MRQHLRPPVPVPCLIVLCLGLLAARPARAQLTTQTMSYGGTTRTWYVHVPASYDGTRAVPLVLALHGVQNSGDQFGPVSEWTPLSDQEGFIVVYPNGGLIYGPDSFGWNDFVYDGSAPDDVGFLHQLILTLEKTYKVDPDRVYMTGFSNGASVTNTFCGNGYTSDLAAIAPCSGDWMTSYGIPESSQHPGGPISTWISRGSLENFTEGDQPHSVQDANQTAYWAGIDGCDPTPRTVVDGIYTTSIYTGGQGEVRFSTVAGYNHQYGPGFAAKIWHDMFSRIVRRGAAVSYAYPAFFAGQAFLADGAYYLAFPGGNPFGYYSFLTDPNYLYHSDLGYEYVFAANDGQDGVYLYDFASRDFFYTSPGFPFPYLYDFGLKSVLYYYPDPNNAGHYNTDGVRYFYDFATGQVVAK